MGGSWPATRRLIFSWWRHMMTSAAVAAPTVSTLEWSNCHTARGSMAAAVNDPGETREVIQTMRMNTNRETAVAAGDRMRKHPAVVAISEAAQQQLFVY